VLAFSEVQIQAACETVGGGRGCDKCRRAQGKSAAAAVAVDADSAVDCTSVEIRVQDQVKRVAEKLERGKTTKVGERAIYHFTSQKISWRIGDTQHIHICTFTYICTYMC